MDAKGQVIYSTGSAERDQPFITFESAMLRTDNMQKEKLGSVVLNLSQSSIIASYRTFLYSAASLSILLLICVYAALAFSLRFITVPLAAIGEAMRRFASGDRDARIPEVIANDSISDITRSFELTRIEFETFQKALEKRVDVRTRALAKPLLMHNKRTRSKANSLQL